MRTARALRRSQTHAERLLWNQLRVMRRTGHAFRRQHPIGRYIVDFVCLDRKLVLEIDGGQHNQPEIVREDEERTLWLETEGYRVLRFWNNDITANLEGVVTVIAQALESSAS